MAKRLLEDTSDDQLDRNDPAVQAILKDPGNIDMFTKNPANAAKNQKAARDIVNKAITRNKSLPLVAKASNIARQAGMN